MSPTDDRPFARVLRWLAAWLMMFGIGIFSLSALLSCVGLAEGVTHREGEGLIRPPESAQQTQERLTFIGCAIAAAPLGWVLARLGDSWRLGVRMPWRLRLRNLTSEALLVGGGACLVLSLQTAANSRIAACQVVPAYFEAAIAAALCGPPLILIGLVLHRRHPLETAEPPLAATATDEHS
jgi:hypothetical protein